MYSRDFIKMTSDSKFLIYYSLQNSIEIQNFEKWVKSVDRNQERRLIEI